MTDPSVSPSSEPDRAPDPIDVDPWPCCPDTLAYVFAGLGAQRLRHVAAWKRWMVWDGTRWRADDTRYAFELARWVCREAFDNLRPRSSERLKARMARMLGGAGFVAQVERMAGGDRRLAMRPERFDADRDLLNTPAGILDTRTGDVTPHRPDAYLTRIAAVAPAEPGVPCPSWSAWLGRIAEGDADLVFYLQRVAGRALTGRDPGPALAFMAADDRRFFTALVAHLRDTAAPPPCSDDLDFSDRLEAEYPAILRWAIEGCLAWRRIGLAPPPQARAAAERRRAAEDALGRWLDEGTEKAPGAWASAGALYAAWQDWAERAGVDPGSRKRFSQALEARGFAPKRIRTGQRGFLGIALHVTGGDEASSVIGLCEASATSCPPSRPFDQCSGGRGTGSGSSLTHGVLAQSVIRHRCLGLNPPGETRDESRKGLPLHFGRSARAETRSTRRGPMSREGRAPSVAGLDSAPSA